LLAKIREPLEVPNLLDLQVSSFDWLVGNEVWREAGADGSRRRVAPTRPTTFGLEEISEEISPIEDSPVPCR
jgi:DNA-directed RNA polymerase subunit beta